MKKHFALRISALLCFSLLCACAPQELPRPTDTQAPSQPSPEKPDKAFTCAAARVNWEDTDEPSPQAWVVNSAAALDALEDRIPRASLDSLESTDRAELLEYIRSYDRKKFSDKRTTLIALQVDDCTGTARYGVQQVAVKDGAIHIELRRTCPFLCTDDMASWLLLVELQDHSYGGEPIRINTQDIALTTSEDVVFWVCCDSTPGSTQPVQTPPGEPLPVEQLPKAGDFLVGRSLSIQLDTNEGDGIVVIFDPAAEDRQECTTLLLYSPSQAKTVMVRLETDYGSSAKFRSSFSSPLEGTVKSVHIVDHYDYRYPQQLLLTPSLTGVTGAVSGSQYMLYTEDSDPIVFNEAEIENIAVFQRVRERFGF